MYLYVSACGQNEREGKDEAKSPCRPDKTGEQSKILSIFSRQANLKCAKKARKE